MTQEFQIKTTKRTTNQKLNVSVSKINVQCVCMCDFCSLFLYHNNYRTVYVCVCVCVCVSLFSIHVLLCQDCNIQLAVEDYFCNVLQCVALYWYILIYIFFFHFHELKIILNFYDCEK